ncbi:MAG: DNA topoisomerase [Clostridia bacterium]|nr:DNA topoisomerase [Clostridia bacterium]
MAKKSTAPQYGNQSISALKGADRVRKRPAVIFGSDGLEGCEHSFFEILSNSVDEAREGYGSEIRITAFSDHSFEIEDFGRGVPLDYNEAEGRYNWELVYCELYAGGKYDNNAEDAAYEYSLGLNGLGACATQYSSEYMHVTSYNNGKVYHIEFAKGEPVTELSIREPQKKELGRTGTIIRWRPDLAVFTDIAVPREHMENVLRKQSVVNSGIRFVFRWENTDGTFDEQTFYYEHGIIDYVSEMTTNAAITPPVLWKLETMGRDRADKPDYKLKAEVSFCFSTTVNLLEYYHNSSFLEHGGSPDKAVRSAFTYAIDKYLKTAGKYNKNEAKITFADVEDCLVLVTSSFSTQPSYANQTKKAITNTFIAEALTDFLKQQLEIYFIEHPIDAEKITSQVLVNKRSRETAESTRLNLKKKLGGTVDMTNRIEKFVGCRSKDPERRELYSVEGDSALTSCKLGRAADFQAIIAVRGKTLNCLKSSYEKIFKSEIICDLLRVIGCGVEVKTKAKSDMMPFDPDALKWSKIIICTDADEDGFQIRTLILTMFYRLLPSLIKMGKVYIAETPLYEINCKDETYYAYDEKDKSEIIEKLGSAKYTIQRSKGLGENTPKMMWQTTMDPQTRHLIRVEPSDEKQTMIIFETLLGDDLPARKEFIALHASEYVRDADI